MKKDARQHVREYGGIPAVCRPEAIPSSAARDMCTYFVKAGRPGPVTRQRMMKFLPVPVSPLFRWIVFNSVGAMGFVVQTGVLLLLVSVAGLHYLTATALAVEAAVLHNFIWHEHWTWADRATTDKCGRFRRLLSFHLANGVISLGGNVLMMRFFVGTLEMHYVPSSVLAVVLCAALNFLAGDRLVFRSIGNRS